MVHFSQIFNDIFVNLTFKFVTHWGHFDITFVVKKKNTNHKKVEKHCSILNLLSELRLLKSNSTPDVAACLNVARLYLLKLG